MLVEITLFDDNDESSVWLTNCDCPDDYVGIKTYSLEHGYVLVKIQDLKLALRKLPEK